MPELRFSNRPIDIRAGLDDGRDIGPFNDATEPTSRRIAASAGPVTRHHVSKYPLPTA